MKKIISIMLVLSAVLALCACDQKRSEDSTTTEKTTVETTAAKYKDSKFLGKWYNADATEEILVCELLADGTAIFEGSQKGTWIDNGDDITITVKKNKKDKKESTMTGYFVIAGDGFVARANEQNQHFLDEGKGELQLEIMLTENTCVDCVKK